MLTVHIEVGCEGFSKFRTMDGVLTIGLALLNIFNPIIADKTVSNH
jgi:hypothetical protein